MFLFELICPPDDSFFTQKHMLTSKRNTLVLLIDRYQSFCLLIFCQVKVLMANFCRSLISQMKIFLHERANYGLQRFIGVAVMAYWGVVIKLNIYSCTKLSARKAFCFIVSNFFIVSRFFFFFSCRWWYHVGCLRASVSMAGQPWLLEMSSTYLSKPVFHG